MAVAAVPTRVTVRRPVFSWLVLATTLPAFIVIGATAASGLELPAETMTLLFGTAHVPLTFGMYADPDLRPFLRAHPARCFAAPILLMLVFGTVYEVAPREVLQLVIAGFVCWQLHHFAKQNVGMLSFWCRANGLAGSDQTERRLIVATGVAGMLGIAPLLPSYAGGRLPFAQALWVTGAVLLLVVGVVMVRRAELERRLPLLAVAVFFLPLFLFPSNPAAAILGFGAAHGAQYYLMVGHLAAPRRWLFPVLASFAVVGYLLMTAPSAGWWRGVVTGVTMAHFVVDAGMWRMKDPERRAYLTSRFSFLRSVR